MQNSDPFRFRTAKVNQEEKRGYAQSQANPESLPASRCSVLHNEFSSPSKQGLLEIWAKPEPRYDISSQSELQRAKPDSIQITLFITTATET